METQEATIEKKCLNCGTLLSDRFCGHCGQDSKEFKLSVWRLFGQFFESITEFDSKFFRSIIPLLFKPGYLTKQFLVGKRKSFLNPIQMYVFCSFVFFLTISILNQNSIDSSFNNSSKDFSKGFINGMSGNQKEEPDDKSLKKDFGSTKDSTSSANSKKKKNPPQNDDELTIDFSDSEYKSVQQYDSAQKALNEAQRDGWLKSWLKRKSMKINEKFKNDSQSFLQALYDKFQENLPNLVFFLLPFFALLLKLLYIRRNFFYVEHLLFSVHIHCFVFVFATVAIILNEFNLLSETMAIVSFWIVLAYLFLAMKRMYEQSWLRTFVKIGLFFFLYAILLLIGVILNLVVSVALLET